MLLDMGLTPDLLQGTGHCLLIDSACLDKVEHLVDMELVHLVRSPGLEDNLVLDLVDMVLVLDLEDKVADPDLVDKGSDLEMFPDLVDTATLVLHIEFLVLEGRELDLVSLDPEDMVEPAHPAPVGVEDTVQCLVPGGKGYPGLVGLQLDTLVVHLPCFVYLADKPPAGQHPELLNTQVVLVMGLGTGAVFLGEGVWQGPPVLGV